jgi:hypothetical protein
VRIADTHERLSTGDGELGLRGRQPRLIAQPGVPSRRRRLEPPRLLIERQQEQRERDLRKLRRHRPRQQDVPRSRARLNRLYALPCLLKKKCD